MKLRKLNKFKNFPKFLLTSNICYVINNFGKVSTIISLTLRFRIAVHLMQVFTYLFVR